MRPAQTLRKQNDVTSRGDDRSVTRTRTLITSCRSAASRLAVAVSLRAAGRPAGVAVSKRAPSVAARNVQQVGTDQRRRQRSAGVERFPVGWVALAAGRVVSVERYRRVMKTMPSIRHDLVVGDHHEEFISTTHRIHATDCGATVQCVRHL